MVEVDTVPWKFKIFARKFKNFMSPESGQRNPSNSTVYSVLYNLLSQDLASRLDHELSDQYMVDRHLKIIYDFIQKENLLNKRRMEYFTNRKHENENDE